MSIKNSNGQTYRLLEYSKSHLRIAQYVFLGLILLSGLGVASDVSASPLVTSPAPGTQISNETETFQWSANGTGLSEWWLYVGTSVGGNEIFDSGSLSSSVNSVTVSGLPTDGSVVWVRLWYKSDYWHDIDVQYNDTGAVTGEPIVTTPIPGTQLTSETETFQWSANGTVVSEWWLHVGTSVGGNEIYNSGSLGGSLFDTVSGLPTDGSTVWLRLWYLSDSWQFIDFQYTAATVGGDPAIITPIPDTQLTSETETFQWSANGAGVSEWRLYVGTSVGGNEIYDSGSLGSGSLSASVSGLPLDGSVVWLRLQYITDQPYSIDYQYTAAVGSGVPAIYDPAPDTQLNGGTETFQWDANGAGVSEWWLYVGTSVGGNDIYDSGSLGSGSLSASVSGLPLDGSVVWVRLQYITDQPYSIDYQYAAAVGGGVPAIYDPAPGTQLNGATETFQWGANGAGVSEWWLYIGTSTGENDIYDSGSLGALSETVSGLPTNGSTIWVRLWYFVGGSWESVDYQHNGAGGGTGEPTITLPVPGSQLNGDTETFQWSANGIGASEWWLYVGTSVGGKEIYDSGSLGGSFSDTVSGLPTDGSTIWVRLWYNSDNWHNIDLQYTANLDGIWILSPTHNALMNQIDVTVQAEAAGFPQNWSVDFVLDNQFGDPFPGSNIQGTSIWRASLGDLSKTTYSLTAVMVDEFGTQQLTLFQEITFGVGDYYVAFGDSLSDGIGDDVSIDNQSFDGRNISNGYTPILNDLLTAQKGFPHSVVVEGISGYDASDGLAEIGDSLLAHPEASHFLIQFGTNDSAFEVPSGYLTNIGDGGYPGTFKDNMQRIIEAVQIAGKVALLAKAPIAYGDCTGSSVCQSYMQEGISPENAAANGYLRNYNLVVDELITLNVLERDPVSSPGSIHIAPALYIHFSDTGLDGEGKSPRFFDWLHPNGVGYQDMACLWSESLTLVPCVLP